MSTSIEETWTCELCGATEIIKRDEKSGPPLGWTKLLIRVNSQPLSVHSDNLFLGDVCDTCRTRIYEAFSKEPGKIPEFAALGRKITDEAAGGRARGFKE